ncbi:MAG: hypothetical protein GY775_19390 [Candidatus Scalindua sp.]|nr:hypothetical protein [Candidatus Scalindua sp.]
MVNRDNDEEIINLVKTILDAADFTVETINESVLVKLMELRNTPIRYDKTYRDIDKDYQRHLQDAKRYLEQELNRS